MHLTKSLFQKLHSKKMFQKKLRSAFSLLVVASFCFSALLTGGCNEKNNSPQTISETGKLLFFDPVLSANNSKSCASCHNPQFAFTDRYKRTLGAFADMSTRNTQGLINVSANKFFNWADTSVTSLEQQMERPLFSHSVIEMGLQKYDPLVLEKLKKNKQYEILFKQSFPGDKEPVSWKNIKTAIAVYVASLQSMNAPYDLYKKGNRSAISKSSVRGEQLFFSSKLNCGSCHVPPFFGADSSLPVDQQYYNIGLYNLAGNNYANDDNGLFTVSKKETDKGKFRTPTLRNLLFTAPYFHDGSAETLEDALLVFEKGGRHIEKGIWLGDGRLNEYKSKLITGYTITAEEQTDLVNFLYSLTDSSVLSNPSFQNPLKTNANK